MNVDTVSPADAGTRRADGPGCAAAAPSSPAGCDAAGTIDIRLDDRPHRVAAGTSLAALVEALGHAPADVASAVNGEFVARAARAGRVLGGGDAVLLFKPIVGG